MLLPQNAKLDLKEKQLVRSLIYELEELLKIYEPRVGSSGLLEINLCPFMLLFSMPDLGRKFFV